MTKLDEIRKRLEAATPGPWFVKDGVDVYAYGFMPGQLVAEIGGIELDADLIANAPSDLALLLRIVERQREALERLASSEAFTFPMRLDTTSQGAELQARLKHASECIAEVDKLAGGGE